MNELDEFHDKVAAEIDRRKIQRLIDSGEIYEDDLLDADILDETDDIC